MEGNNQKWLIVLAVIATVAVAISLFAVSLIMHQNNVLRQEISSVTNQLSSQIIELKAQSVASLDEQMPNQNSDQAASIDSSIASSEPALTQNNNIIYSNSNYGFSLQLPPAWKGYTTKTEVRSDGASVYFGFSSWTSIFAVGVYTKDQWNKILSEGDSLSKRTYIGENNKYVFTSSKAQDYGDPKYNSLVNDFDIIMATFKTLTK